MDMTDRMPKGWHSRGYLPHFNAGEVRRWSPSGKTVVATRAGGLLACAAGQDSRISERRRISGRLRVSGSWAGPAFMLREVVRLWSRQRCCIRWDRYHLLAWVVMSNHVHALLLPRDPMT